LPVPVEYFDLDIRFREGTEKKIFTAEDTVSDCESCGCQSDEGSECFCTTMNCPSQTPTMCMACPDTGDQG